MFAFTPLRIKKARRQAQQRVHIRLFQEFATYWAASSEAGQSQKLSI
jgi:hypothetical protein